MIPFFKDTKLVEKVAETIDHKYIIVRCEYEKPHSEPLYKILKQGNGEDYVVRYCNRNLSCCLEEMHERWVDDLKKAQEHYYDKLLHELCRWAEED